MNRADIVGAYPELVQAAEVPVLDTSCACLMRLARVVHDQGYKVVLTGEGSDEALAGYVWFKGQKFRNAFARNIGEGIPKGLRSLALAMVGGGRDAHPPDLHPIGGARVAQQDMFDFLGQARALLYSNEMWDRLGGYSPYDELNALCNDRFSRWHPLNQSLYVGYKVMLAGLLLVSKGDRIAMHSSVETCAIHSWTTT